MSLRAFEECEAILTTDLQALEDCFVACAPRNDMKRAAFPPRNDRKIFAFTLSEVLITLVVIGIVAALTVPTIVAKQREQATVEKVKKFYSTLSQAVKRAVIDTGLPVTEWDLVEDYRTASISFMGYIRPYLSIMNDDCGKDTGSPCYSTVMIKSLNGNDAVAYYSSKSTYYKAMLIDGSVFWFRTNGATCNRIDRDVCAVFWYDINGLKEPNVAGKDIFLFYVKSDNNVIPLNSGCDYSNLGYGCSAYILKNGNMDYLH